MTNLNKSASWYNPYTALIGNSNSGKGVVISNIKIFNEKGILFETRCGWFNNNNTLGDIDIKEIKMKRKINFNNKYNFIIKDSEGNYVLYIYYKNINYRNSFLNLDSTLLTLNAIILNNYQISQVIGYRDTIIWDYKEKNDIDNLLKKIDNYHLDCRLDEMIENLDLLRKHCKKIKKLEEQTRNLTLNDIDKMIYRANGKQDIQVLEEIELNKELNKNL